MENQKTMKPSEYGDKVEFIGFDVEDMLNVLRYLYENHFDQSIEIAAMAELCAHPGVISYHYGHIQGVLHAVLSMAHRIREDLDELSMVEINS